MSRNFGRPVIDGVRALLARVSAVPRRRTWTVSTRVGVALAVPLVVAIVAGTVAIVAAANARAAAADDERFVGIGQASATTLAALQEERALSAGAAGPGEGADPQDVRAEVNSRVAELDHLITESGGLGTAGEAVRAQLSRLNELRGVVAPEQAITGYATVTQALLDLNSALVPLIDDRTLAHEVTALGELSGAHEYLARQQTLLDAGLSAGTLSPAALGQAREATALAAGTLRELTASVSGDELARYQRVVSTDAWNARTALVDEVIDENGQLRTEVTAERWREGAAPLTDRIGDEASRLGAESAAAAAAASSDAAALVRALVVGLGVVVLGGAVLLFGVLRHVRTTLSGLRAGMLDIARHRLPEQLAAVREGRAPEAEQPKLPVVADNEFGAMAVAFEAVCGEAVAAAEEQARTRAGYSEVFAYMFLRSRSLVQRQLRLIEQLEKDAASPDELAKLFQLDHLVTRMRRNNENVLVLSGTELARRSSKPVTVSSVVQAALSEIEQYQRVEVSDVPSAKVIDSAAGDLIRILAELLDNATSFSAPETTVSVQAQILRDGSLSFAVVDSGIGMSDEEIRDVNDRLGRLGSSELVRSRRVGLLVVGRLAGRHGFGVELLGGDKSVGVAVVVSVPSELVVDAERPGWADRRLALQAASARRAPHAAQAVQEERTGDDTGRDDTGRDDTARGERHGTRRLSTVGVAAGAAAGQPPRKTAPTVLGGRSRTLDAGDREALVRQSHANVPEELPVRTPNRLIGRARATSAAFRAASGWFQARDTAGRPRAVSPAVAVAGEEPSANWRSAADEGWNIVETVSRAESYTYTDDGLPVRERGAHLLPGSAKHTETTPEQPVERDPSHTRSRLSSYRSGIRKAKGGKGSDVGSQGSSGWTSLGKN